jgi:putative CocE/NonD family hydrolase
MPAAAQLARIERHAVALRDGVALATDVHRPSDTPLPALLLRTPYDRANLQERVREVDPLLAMAAGFAVVIQDLRGRGDSGGAFHANWPDAEDGADTVAWIRRQRWSDGRVAMVGSSYDGCVQFQAARARPRGLVAIAPTASGALREIWYPGGALRLRGVAAWMALLLAEALPAEHDAAARAELRELLDATPLERLHALLEPGTAAWELGAPLRHWIAAPPSDRFWTEVTAIPREPLPALHTSGWFDSCLAPAVAAYERWSATAGPEQPQLLTLGPWDHALQPVSVPELSLIAEHPRSAVLERQLAFVRSVLDGTPGEGLAPVLSFVIGRSRWHQDVCWPPADVRSLALRLAAGGGRAGRLCHGPLGAQSRAPMRYRYDPRDPAPTVGGATGVEGRGGPLEQSWLERREDVLTFTSEPLTGELEIAGAPRARLLVASSASATDFVVRLAVVLPDDRSLVLTEGVWSGRLADLPAAPAGAGHRTCEVALAPTHAVVAAGRRLRLELTSSSYPELYPNPNTGHDLALGAPPRVAVAEQSLLACDSLLRLPVRGSLPRELAA